MPNIHPQIDAMSVVILFGLLQCLSIVGLFYFKGILKENRLITVLIVVLMAIQTETFLIRSGYIIKAIFLMNTTAPLVLLIGPLVYAYTLLLSGKRIPRMFALHFTPGLLYLIYSFNFILQPVAFKYNALIRSFHPHLQTIPFLPTFDSDPLNVQGWVVVEGMCLSMAVYALISMIALARKDKTPSGKLPWLRYVNVMLLFSALVLFLAQGGVVNGYVFFKSPFPHFAPDLCTTLLMYSITFYLILKPEHFRKQTPKYQKSPLQNDFRKRQLERICSVIESEKLYLLPDFSPDMLSAKTGLAKHHISQILNEDLNQSFYDFTHRYRIDEAKRILNETGHIKMEQLAYHLGYKSKVTFFNAFKRSTELTPAQYKMKMG